MANLQFANTTIRLVGDQVMINVIVGCMHWRWSKLDRGST